MRKRTLATDLEVECIAEGVETKQRLELHRRLGCRSVDTSVRQSLSSMSERAMDESARQNDTVIRTRLQKCGRR